MSVRRVWFLSTAVRSVLNKPKITSQMVVELENGAFTGGILGILVKWPSDVKGGVLGILIKWRFDLKMELSPVESLEF